MAGIEVIGLAISTISLVNLTFQRIRGERITKSRDIVANFTELQAERVIQIQSEIILLISQRRSEQPASGEPSLDTEEVYPNRVGNALHRYAQALRDYETLSQESLQYNPFVKPKWYSRVPDVLELFLEPPLRPYPEIAPIVNTFKLRELDKKGRLLREKKYASVERLLLGSFGGIMLIGPMLLMVLNYSRNTTLITTSVATILFTVVLATLARGMAGKDVLAAVAAYAAVLVVFVGTSITPPATA